MREKVKVYEDKLAPIDKVLQLRMQIFLKTEVAQSAIKHDLHSGMDVYDNMINALKYADTSLIQTNNLVNILKTVQ